ncbi:MAG: hypothetical protein RL398_2393 [Planctomycetota bacterium]
MRLPLALSVLALASTALAQQIAVPAFGSTFTSTLTRGFWFQAPTGFIITGLEVPNEALQPNQVVEVIDLGTAGPPPSYPTTITGTQLFYDNATPAGQIIPCSIPVAPGQYIGILGACNNALGSATSYNSYATPAGAYQSTILGLPTTLTRFGTQSGIASNGGNQQCWQEPAGALARVNVYIAPLQGFATATPFGSGCGREFSSFYENAGAFDLSNTSLQMNFLGTGYAVIPGTTPIAPQTSAPVTMGDDVVVQFPLGWAFPYNGGVATDLAVSSNGFVHLGVLNTNAGCCSFNAALFFNGGSPCFAAKWRDLNPSAGGTVQFDTDPINGIAYVTFTGVPDFGSTTNLNDFQYVFNQSGTVELRFGNCAPTAGATGYSGGVNAFDPGQIDISAQAVIVTGSIDRPALAHNAGGRPVLGTTIAINTTNAPAGTLLGANVLGLFDLSPGIDLTALGMPGCTQYITADASLVWVPAGGVGTTQFAVPVNPAFAGLNLYSQGAAVVPGINGAGALTSNAVRLTLDIN